MIERTSRSDATSSLADVAHEVRTIRLRLARREDWADVAHEVRTIRLRLARRNDESGVVVETGVDPVTFRFSGGRSAN